MESDIVSDSRLTSPTNVCLIIGGILFLLGLLGSLGALTEHYCVLIIVSGHDK